MANNVVPDPQPVTLEKADGTAQIGQQTAANSVPVVIASNQTAVPVTATGAAASGAAVTGNPVLIAGTDTTNARTILTTSSGIVAVAISSTSSAALADGVTNSPTTPGNYSGTRINETSYQFVYNGATWDRTRGNTNGAFGVPVASTGGQALTKFRDPAVTNTAVAIKASAGKLHWYNLYNPNASLVFVHFYNVAAGSVTVGTTTPAVSIALPSTANGTIALDSYNNIGLDFATAISVAASTTATGGTAPSTAVVVNAGYI